MFIALLAATMSFAPPLSLQDAQQDGPQGPPQRVRNILLYGQDECPKPENSDEIVVCAKVGDSPYRIPKEFRDAPRQDAAAQAWSNRVETVEQVNRAGLPNSCSPIGSGGQTGCTRQFIQQWYQERLDRKMKQSRIPGGGN